MGLPVGQGDPVDVSGAITSPSTWSGETPASSMALRSARMLQAPKLVSVVSSQRRAVGDTPMPTATTFPLCSQTPNPSVLLYIDAGAFSVGMVHPLLQFPWTL